MSKFNPVKAVQKAAKEPSAEYAIEMVLAPEEAAEFEYLSHWRGGENVYRVAALLKHGDNVKVQMLKVQPAPNHDIRG